MSEDAPDENEEVPDGEPPANDEAAEQDADPEPEAEDGDAEESEPEGENGEEEAEGEEEVGDEEAEDEGEVEEEEADEANGDEESDDLPVEPLTEETLTERLDGAEAALEEAETEDDLDDVSATLVSIGDDLEEADLPEPDEDDEDEDAEDPREALEERLEGLQEELEEQRGPYSEDVIEEIEAAGTTIDETRWTEKGETELVEPVESFVETVNDVLGTHLGLGGEEPDALVAVLESAAVAVGDAELDPDEDAEEIATLLEAVEELQAALEESEEWDDLSTRQKLAAHGFYDVLDHRKDFPPEWHALKVYEKRGEPEPILLALEQLGSEFMERHCIESLTRMGDEAALDAMTQRANKRDKPAIKALGKIGSDESVEMLSEYIEGDSDPKLQLVTLKALGEIGSEDATQAVADRLVADDDEIRSRAARALGLIGDTRAIAPLSDVLEDDDVDAVRASAAWALNQIGTQEALDAVEPYADDRAFLVQSEAEKVA